MTFLVDELISPKKISNRNKKDLKINLKLKKTKTNRKLDGFIKGLSFLLQFKQALIMHEFFQVLLC